jgi:CheY-like chemotaxis protein
MSFPLYRRPGGILFLDDDPAYLEMLGDVMPDGWHVRLYMQPADCIAALQSEAQRWEADAWKQQEMINRWHEGLPLIPQLLHYWKEDGTNRFDLTQVCVVDYSMPSMSGLRMLSEVKAWTGSRILLTGRADELLGVSAFNRGLIEKFIPKQSPELRKRLTEAIGVLQAEPNARHQNMWQSTLSRDQHALLELPEVEKDLQALTLKHGWVEYILIGAPFGMLALDSQGSAVWIQLEPAEKLSELADMAESQGCTSSEVEEIRAGRKLIDLELRLALGKDARPVLRNAVTLGSERILLAALFELEPSGCPGSAGSFASFVTQQGDRRLRG